MKRNAVRPLASDNPSPAELRRALEELRAGGALDLILPMMLRTVADAIEAGVLLPQQYGTLVLSACADALARAAEHPDGDPQLSPAERAQARRQYETEQWEAIEQLSEEWGQRYVKAVRESELCPTCARPWPAAEPVDEVEDVPQ